MKKIKLISFVTLASSLVLAGCGEQEHQHTWDNKWSFNETQHWVVATCHPDVCDHLGNHVDANPADGKCDVCGYQMSTPTPPDPTQPSVKSVTVNGNKNSVSVGETVSLQATVAVFNSAPAGVTWSVDKTNLATLSSTTGSSVTLTTKAAGTVVVTATSIFDNSKSGSFTVTITKADWNNSVKAMMQEYLGFVVPHFDGNFTWTDEYFDEYQCLTAESSVSSDYDKAVAGFTAAGWEIEDYEDEVYAIYETEDTQYLADIYEYDGVVSVDVYAYEIVREWPSEDLAEALETLDIDFTLPVFTTTESVRYSLDVELDEESGEGYIDLIVSPESESGTISHLDYVALFDDSFTKTQDEYGDYEIVPENKSCAIYVMSVLDDEYEEIPGFEVIVVPYIADYTIKASAPSEFLQVNSTLTVSVDKIGADIPEDAVISFASDKPAVATVSADGVVTGVSEGKVVITASYQGFNSSVTIYVKNVVATEFTQEQLDVFKNIHDVEGLEVPYNGHFNSVDWESEFECVSITGNVVGPESFVAYREALIADGWVDLIEEQGYYDYYLAIYQAFGMDVTKEEVIESFAFDGISFEKEVKIDDSVSYWINANLYLFSNDEEPTEGELNVEVFDPYYYSCADAIDGVFDLLTNFGVLTTATLPDTLPGSHFAIAYDEDYNDIDFIAYDATNVTIDDVVAALNATNTWVATKEHVDATVDDYGNPVEAYDYISAFSTDDVLEIEGYVEDNLVVFYIYLPVPPISDDVVFGDLGLEDGALLSEIDFVTASGYSIVFDIGGNGSKAEPKYYENGSQARCYASNTITISAPDGEKLPSFTVLGVSNNGGTLSANTGTLSSVSGGYSWSGDASEVVLSVSAKGQFRITEIDLSAK